MEFIYYFENVFTFTNILILILGTIGGLLMGAAPGLSPTMAVALSRRDRGCRVCHAMQSLWRENRSWSSRKE